MPPPKETLSWCLSGEEHPHPDDTLLHKLFEDLLEANPDILDKVALVNNENDTTTTFGQLNKNASLLARVILRTMKKNTLQANPDGDYIIALRFLPTDEMITTILAIFKAGLAYVPIAPNWPEGRIQHIIDDAAPVMIITNTRADILYKAQKSLPGTKMIEIFQYEDMVEEGIGTSTSVRNIASDQTLNNTLKGNRLYSVLYTSGSTGTPKGVRHVHRAALNRLHWQWRIFPYEDDEVCVFKTTLTFVDSVTEIWSSLLSGKKLVIFPTKVIQNVEKFIEMLELHKIGRIFVVTSLVKSILAYLRLEKSAKKRLSNVKIWECSAETVTSDVLISFFNYFPTGHMISNFYGSTEMMDVTYETFSCKHDVLAKAKDEKIPIGVPVDNTKAYVLDHNMEPITEGATGSLYICGRNLGDGYVGTKKGSFMNNKLLQEGSNEIHQSTKNGSNIPNNYGMLYKTGDYAKIYKGRLYYEGRCDSQLKVRGHRVDLSEIEATVLQVKGVRKICILCYKPGEPQQKILCYYTIESDETLPELVLEQILSTKLPSYMMPKLIKLSVLPLLVNGKTDKQSLLAKYTETLICTTFTFTEDDFSLYISSEHFNIAKVVLESVASITANASHKPTLNDNFFNIGGDSINMVQVISRINDHGYYISVTDFVTSNKLLEVIENISTVPIADDLSHIVKKLQKRNDYSSGDLKEEHKDIVLDMISRSFANKGDLITLADGTYDTLKEHLLIMWAPLLKSNLSIVITNKDGKVIGACLNFDARSDEAAPFRACSAFSRNMPENAKERRRLRIGENNNNDAPLTVGAFLDAIEEPLKEKYVPGGKGQFIHTSLLGTDKGLDTAENVEVAMFMEQENIRIAKMKGFKGVFTTNANRLTQLISRSLNYTVLASVQVNKYEDESGTRPFHDASDDLVTEVAIRWL